jgi:hypothetical protein
MILRFDLWLVLVTLYAKKTKETLENKKLLGFHVSEVWYDNLLFFRSQPNPKG